MGYPEKEEIEEGKEEWSIYYVDERFGSAMSLIDSAVGNKQISALPTLEEILQDEARRSRGLASLSLMGRRIVLPSILPTIS